MGCFLLNSKKQLIIKSGQDLFRWNFVTFKDLLFFSTDRMHILGLIWICIFQKYVDHPLLEADLKSYDKMPEKFQSIRYDAIYMRIF